MVTLATTLQLAGYALGALGASLLFVELFQMPSYVGYDRSTGSYTLTHSPPDPAEYTWVGRVGALLLAAAFAVVFLATFLDAGLA